MREVLFRGKRFDNGKWAEGSAVWFDDDQCFIMPPYSGASTMSYTRIFTLTAVMVDPSTVGQYTGLTDKNGVKIFEGDILEGLRYHDYGQWGENEPCKFVVAWDAAKAGFSILYFFDGYTYDLTTFEVIGNIHDNPELLKEAQP